MMFEVAAYIILCFVLSVFADLVYVKIVSKGVSINPNRLTPSFIAYDVIRMYIPFLTVLLVLTLHGDSVHKFLSFLAGWLKWDMETLILFLTAPSVTYLALLLYSYLSKLMGIFDSDKFGKIVGGDVKSACRSLVFLIVASYVASLTVNSIATLGEEVGWRAFLFTNLCESLGLLNAIVLTGLVRGLWHVSLVLLVEYDSPFYEPRVNSLAYVGFCLVLSVPSSILLLKTGSLLPVLSLHGSVNSIWRMTETITKINQQYRVRILLLAPTVSLVAWCISITLFMILIGYI